MKDIVTFVVEMAFEAYKRGDITKEEMIEHLQMAINARAHENGYVEEFGLPFPEAK